MDQPDRKSASPDRPPDTLPERTLFTQWIPPTLLFGGLALFLSIGQAVVGRKWDLFPIFLIWLIFFAIWMIFIGSVRFEPDRMTVWWFVFIPQRIRYDEVSELIFLYADPKAPEIPTTVIFRVKSGKYQTWLLGFFTQENRRKIREELDARIRLPESVPERQDVQKWADTRMKNPLLPKIFAILGLLITLAFGIDSMCRQLVWNHRIRTWDKADGIILRNAIREIKSGRSTRKISDVAYSYTCRGKQYTGTRIVYDDESFPPLKPGTHRQVIVNPDDPRDCAVMFWYRGYWWMLRWAGCAGWYLLALVCGAMLWSLRNKKIEVPDRLKEYLLAFTAEELMELLEKEKRYTRGSGVPMPKRWEMDLRSESCVIEERCSVMFILILWCVLCLGSLWCLFAARILFPILLYPLLLGGLCLFVSLLCLRTVLDFREKTIRIQRRWLPWKWCEMKTVPFAEIDHLVLSGMSPDGGNAGVFTLNAYSADGTANPICRISKKNLPPLLEQLPDLAERLGHLPILFH